MYDNLTRTNLEFAHREAEKRIADLEQKISVLLSCKNCPENKDGLICQKEYENKCLAQKIQYIKKLEKENAELKVTLTVGSTWNKALNSMNKALEEERDKYRNMVFDKMERLAKAKEVIEELYNICPASMSEYAKEPMEHARKFMTEE